MYYINMAWEKYKKSLCYEGLMLWHQHYIIKKKNYFKYKINKNYSQVLFPFLIKCNTFNNKFGCRCLLLVAKFCYTGIFSSVWKLHINNMKFPVFAIRNEPMLGAFSQVAAILHPGGNSSRGWNKALENCWRSNRLCFC